MATLGFLRRDFDVFAIDDFSARLSKIDQFVTPRLMQLSPDFNRKLSLNLHVVFFPHFARHARRAANPHTETWVAWGPSPNGYRRHGYLALFISGVGVHARAVVQSAADHRPAIALAIKSKSAHLEKSFRGTKIQQYQNWEGRELPNSIAASASFFDGLGDALAKKSGSIDVGFGWPVRDALTVDRAEVLDAFRELGPLYHLILSVAS
jgi:uncharacterized protein YktB (UPF0637 family)